MGNLKRGKLLIRTEDLLDYMELTSDTHIEAVQTAEGIEIKIIANSSNDKQWLIQHKDEKSYSWSSYPKFLVPLESKSETLKGYDSFGKPVYQEEIIKTKKLLNNDSNEIVLNISINNAESLDVQKISEMLIKKLKDIK